MDTFMLHLIFKFTLGFFFISLIGYWSVSRVLVSNNKIPRVQMWKLGCLITLTFYLPITLFYFLENEIFLIFFFFIFPLAIFCIKKMRQDDSYTLKLATRMYFAVLGRMLFVMFILGLIVHSINFLIKQ